MTSTKDPNNGSQKVGSNVKLFGITGALMTAIGGVVILVLPIVINFALDSQMQLKREGNDVTRAWQRLPLPITCKVYIFSIENPRAYSRGAKPVLKEMGPYVYSKKLWKQVVGWSRDGQVVKYYQYSSWTYDPTQTVGDRRDRVTVVNSMAAVISGLINRLPLSFAVAPVAFGAVNALFSAHDEGLLKRVTVRQLLEGYTFSIMQTIDTVTKPLALLGIKLPDLGMPQNKFGIFHVKNNTKEGPYEVYTGQGNPSKMGKVIKYKGKRQLTFYNDPKCNMINGTDGVNMGRYMTSDTVPYIFKGDACRSIYIKYKERVFVKGMPVLRYILPKDLFAGPHKNPGNRCFCTTPQDYNKCDGILDLGHCQSGAPIALSFPHFMHASKKIMSGVKGLSPDPDKHESFFDVQQVFGAPVRASGKLQVNLLMKPNPFLVGFGNIKETVLPLLWLDEGGGVEGRFALIMQIATFSLIFLDWGSILALVTGIIVIGYTAYLAFKQRIKSKEDKIEKFDLKSEKENQLENQVKTLYPDLFSLTSDGKQFKDIHLYSVVPEVKTQQKAQAFSDYCNSDKQRMIFSPPGTLE